eukprot:5400710-Prymnesium_polylepis.1
MAHKPHALGGAVLSAQTECSPVDVDMTTLSLIEYSNVQSVRLGAGGLLHPSSTGGGTSFLKNHRA